MGNYQVKDEAVKRVSVVIPTRNRIQECVELFTGLKKAVDNAGDCEVIVVDDSDPSHAESINQQCSKYGYKYISTDIHSVAKKRNIGWMSANGDIILFLDSDCLPEEDLILRHLDVYLDEDAIGCLGDLMFIGTRSIYFRATEITPFARAFQFARRFESTTWGPTANISFRRSELERVGGFDTTFPDRPGGEDVDLGLRITENKKPISCNAFARVGHATSTWNDYSANLKRFFGWGRADYHLIIKQPHKTITDLPRIPLIFLLLMAVSLVLSVAKMNLYFFTMPILWLFLTLILATLLFHCEEGHPPFKERMIALTYILANEIGTLHEGFSHFYWPIIYKRMNYGAGQVYGEWYEAGKRLWAQWIALMICFWIY